MKDSKKYLLKENNKLVELDGYNNISIPDPDQDLAEIDFGGGTKYTRDDKIKAASLYAVLGNSIEVSRIFPDVPAATIRKWKQETIWWDTAVIWAKKKFSSRLEARMTGILDKLVNKINERIETGNVTILRDGTKQVVPQKLSELTNTYSVLYDKLALMTGNVTSRKENVSTEAVLDRIAERFEKMQSSKELKVVSTQ